MVVTNIMYISRAGMPLERGVIYTFTLCLSVKADRIPGRVRLRGCSRQKGGLFSSDNLAST
jgi:hypothetical protein